MDSANTALLQERRRHPLLRACAGHCSLKKHQAAVQPPPPCGETVDKGLWTIDRVGCSTRADSAAKKTGRRDHVRARAQAPAVVRFIPSLVFLVAPAQP